jgi:hypothetical protein
VLAFTAIVGIAIIGDSVALLGSPREFAPSLSLVAALSRKVMVTA